MIPPILVLRVKCGGGAFAPDQQRLVMFQAVLGAYTKPRWHTTCVPEGAAAEVRRCSARVYPSCCQLVAGPRPGAGGPCIVSLTDRSARGFAFYPDA